MTAQACSRAKNIGGLACVAVIHLQNLLVNFNRKHFTALQLLKIAKVCILTQTPHMYDICNDVMRAIGIHQLVIFIKTATLKYAKMLQCDDYPRSPEIHVR